MMNEEQKKNIKKIERACWLGIALFVVAYLIVWLSSGN